MDFLQIPSLAGIVLVLMECHGDGGFLLLTLSTSLVVTSDRIQEESALPVALPSHFLLHIAICSKDT